MGAMIALLLGCVALFAG